jgi:hypothetical protein
VSTRRHCRRAFNGSGKRKITDADMTTCTLASGHAGGCALLEVDMGEARVLGLTTSMRKHRGRNVDARHVIVRADSAGGVQCHVSGSSPHIEYPQKPAHGVHETREGKERQANAP